MMGWCRSTPVVAATDAIVAAHDALRWGGVVLPRVPFSGGALYPVISWTSAAERRNAEGPEPTLCRPTLSGWEEDGPESAVRIVGFLHAGAPAAGISRLKAVAAYGPGAIVVADGGRIGRWTLAEADVAGISVLEIPDDANIRTLVHGRNVPVASARRSVATRLREEQLYGWALHVGVGPAGEMNAAWGPAAQWLVS